MLFIKGLFLNETCELVTCIFSGFFCIRPTAVLLIMVLNLDLYAILNQHRNVQSSQVDPAILITLHVCSISKIGTG